MTFFRRPVAAVLLLMGTALWSATLRAAEGDDLSLGSLRSNAAQRRLDPVSAQEGPAGALAAAAGLEHLPTRCGTPLVRAATDIRGLWEPDLERSLRAIVDRRFFADRSVITTPQGSFAVHFSSEGGLSGMLTIDTNRNGLPDPVDRVLEALEAARSVVVTGMDYSWPVREGTAPIDVYLAPLGRGIESYTVTAPQGPPFIVIDERISPERIMSAVMHQVAHVAIGASARDAAPWWEEATATFVTFAATGDLDGPGRGMTKRLQNPEISVTSDRPLAMQGAALWLLYLVESTGDPTVARQIWEAVSTGEVDILPATDAVLRRYAGMSLEGAEREYAAWNLFTGARAEGHHYSIARSLPEMPLPALGPVLPLREIPEQSVEPFGSLAFRLQGDGIRGSVEVEIVADGGTPGADLLVAYRSSGPERVLVPVPLDESGVGRVLVPSGDLEDIWIILRNSSSASGSTRFEVRGRHNPYAPYDLASFTARPMAGSLLLEWTTASEKGLLGWNIHRADRPSGPFDRINDVAIPAFGDGSDEIGYVFVDDSSRPGRRYYYLLEGLTVTGLAERSHLASGRVTPSR